MSDNAVSGLPPAQTFIAGHNSSLKPVVVKTSSQVPMFGPWGAAALYRQEGFEVDPVSTLNSAKETNGKYEFTMLQENGVVVRAVDIPPNTETPNHHVQAVDYLVFTHGSLDMVLGDGIKETVRAGDVVVQLANVHQWMNSSNEWARFVCVTLPSKAVQGKNGEDLSKAFPTAQNF